VTPILATLAGCSDEAARLRQACLSNHAAACLTLGDVLARGDVVPRDLDGAREARDAACRLGSAEGCARLAEQLLLQLETTTTTTTTPEPSARALGAYDRACNGGLAAACEQLGHLHGYGVGANKDPVRARVAYDAACKAHRAVACARLQELDGAAPAAAAAAAGAAAPVADAAKPEHHAPTVFTLRVVGKDANPDKERRCRERILGLGARLSKAAPITVTLSLATQNRLKIASHAHGVLFEASLPSSTVPDLCREVELRAARAFARESERDDAKVL